MSDKGVSGKGMKGRYSVSIEPLRTERRLELIALLLALALLLLLALGGYRLSALQRPAQVNPAADSLAVSQTLSPAGITEQESAAMRGRPLFWASRRPAEAEKPQPTGDEKVGQIDGIRLVGVFGSGDSAGIIVTIKDSAKKRLTVGQKVNGWRLERVSGGEAVMKAGARSKTLVLGKAAPGKSAKNRKRPRRAP